MTNLQRSIQNARRSLNIDTGRGLLGDLSGNIVEAGTGRYWVREEVATNSYAPAVPMPLVQGGQLPAILNMIVEIGLNGSRQNVILGMDNNSVLQQGINPAITNSADPIMTGLIEKERLSPLFTQPDPDQTTFALYASVYPGKLLVNNTYSSWAGGRIDLSGEVPAGGQHLYTIVFWKTDNTLEIASSTTQATGTALDATDIQQALDGKTAGSLPLWAFVLTGGDTILDATNSLDLRLLWAGAGANQAVINNTTRVTTTYTILVTDHVVFANTDGGGYTVTLPAGVEGQEFKINNSGSSANALAVAPNGAEDLLGDNSNFTLEDTEKLVISFSEVDGWY